MIVLYVGCGKLFSVDGNWKLCYPICMYHVPKEISGFNGALQYVDSCPNQPVAGMAFCEKHCEIPCMLQEFQEYSRKGTYVASTYVV